MFKDYFVLQIIFCLIMGYFFGIFSSGYFIGKIYHVDVKSKGSGNLGTTNVLRVVGLKAGIITLVIDLGKTIIPLMLTRFVLFPQYEPMSDMNQLMVLYTAFGAVCGHLFPFYLKFRGGKGIACMGACMLIYDWRLAAIGLAIFIAILVFTRYMSLASLTASVLFPVFVGITSQGNIHMILVTLLFTISAFYNHRQNIVRLINHNENKLSVKKKDKEEKTV
ncbi:MAG: glycerol-3-phosphate 1-O-acyltransferase PlsY [Lachnospiraceae bacterium]|nr:glycerol-3-phosphate 1-O-acyltransferase PlsY [Lachnospiraceae bacterium]